MQPAKATTVCKVTAVALVLFVLATNANASELGGYECTDDCSGHAAGYRWAEAHNIADASNCPLRGNATSFYEGCLVYVEDLYRGADEDDDGDPI
jgi:hypothetical protein